MTTKEYIAHLKNVRRDLDGMERDIGLVIADIHAKQTSDIFQKGINAKYSTRPTLAGANVFGNRNKFGRSNYTFATRRGSNRFFGSKAKIKQAQWVRVQTPLGPRNLQVIKGGYAALRRADGRQTNRVDLNRTGVLFRDYASSLTRTGRLSWATGVRRKENVGKIAGAVSKYGAKTFELSAKDLARFNGRLGEIALKLVAA